MNVVRGMFVGKTENEIPFEISGFFGLVTTHEIIYVTKLILFQTHFFKKNK